VQLHPKQKKYLAQDRHGGIGQHIANDIAIDLL
jgi:hypothetical protein